MRVSRPLTVTIPPSGVAFAESVHGPDFQMRPRADAYHKLLYVLRGRIRFRAAGGPGESCSEGALLLVPAETRHEIADERAATLLLMCVTDLFLSSEPELLEVWRRQSKGSLGHVKVSGPARAQLENCWRRALLERAQPRPAGAAALRALALQVLVQLARLPPVPPGESAAKRVAVVVREIQDTFVEHWTLDGAATRAGMSRRHFSGIFRETVGLTFGEYLTDVRLVHAAHLLQKGEHSIAGVIFACGFGDVTQFYRLFRVRYGKPPKEWVSSRSPKTGRD